MSEDDMLVGDAIITKQAEIELAGQAAARTRPPLDGSADAVAFSEPDESNL